MFIINQWLLLLFQTCFDCTYSDSVRSERLIHTDSLTCSCAEGMATHYSDIVSSMSYQMCFSMLQAVEYASLSVVECLHQCQHRMIRQLSFGPFCERWPSILSKYWTSVAVKIVSLMLLEAAEMVQQLFHLPLAWILVIVSFFLHNLVEFPLFCCIWWFYVIKEHSESKSLEMKSLEISGLESTF